MIFEIFGTDAQSMTKSLMTAGDVTKRIPKDANIALKPNLVRAGSPETGATTHPGVLSGCIEYLQENGFSNISIIESSWIGGNTQQSFKTCGYDKVCQKYNVPFYDLKADKVKRVDTPLRPMEISQRALDADFLIDLPVLKGHSQTRITCALKNLKGCIPDHEKRQFHAEGLFKPIAALASALTPNLVIVDSICGDLYFEDGGNPVNTNRMMLGFDAVQMDMYGCRLMGIDPESVPYIALSEKWGAGNSHINHDEIIRLNEPANSQKYPPASGLVKKLTKNVTADGACSACFASLVRALYIADREGCTVKEKICIGQGFQDRKPDGIGIGRCCSQADICVMGCPPTAEAILEKLR